MQNTRISLVLSYSEYCFYIFSRQPRLLKPHVVFEDLDRLAVLSLEDFGHVLVDGAARHEVQDGDGLGLAHAVGAVFALQGLRYRPRKIEMHYDRRCL